jgi:hypothetical protein
MPGGDPPWVFNFHRLHMGFKLICGLVSVLEFNARSHQCREMRSAVSAPLFLVGEHEFDRRRKSSLPRSGALSFSFASILILRKEPQIMFRPNPNWCTIQHHGKTKP